MTTVPLRLTRSILVLAALLAIAAPVAAQPTATLAGSVTDVQGGALPGALVVVRHASNGDVREVTIGPDGRFVVTDVAVGGPYTPRSQSDQLRATGAS